MLNNSYSNLRWAFNISNWKPMKEQWKLAVQCVQKDESERCNKFCFVEDCKSAMVGRLLMRKAANECSGLQYDKIYFSRTASGKPYLVNENTTFNFNISHHGDFCVLASTNQNFNVGIDVMKVEHRGRKPVEDFFLTMKKQFSSYEWNFISQPGLQIEQLGRFYRLWCLKESYVKATGTGIACDLQSISFSCPTPILHESIITVDTKLYLNGISQPQWRFEETFLDTKHCVAVALEPKDYIPDMGYEELDSTNKSFVFLCFEDLMQNCKPFESAEENFWESFESKNEKKLL